MRIDTKKLHAEKNDEDWFSLI